MMQVNDNNDLTIDPRLLPAGHSVITVARGNDEAYEVLGMLMDWITKTNLMSRCINDVTWSIHDDRKEGLGTVKLCILSPDIKERIVICEKSRIVEIMNYLFVQFAPLTPDLRAP